MEKCNLSQIMKAAWTIRRMNGCTMSSALKKAWANAKKEENKVDNSEIKALIDKYSLVQRGDKIGTYATRGINKAEFMREVCAHKAEIMAYFEAEKKAATELRTKREKTFESIPGVAELRKARTQRAEWQQAFNRMMETGSSKMPHIDAPTADKLTEMECLYPMAVFALDAEYRAHTTENDQLRTIWNITYDALCDGNAPESVKADHDARMNQYASNNLWN